MTGKEYYRYHGQGRRSLNWSPIDGVRLSAYSRDGKLRYQEQEPTQERTSYVYLGGSEIARRVWHFNGALNTKFVHTDALGSPVAVTNQVATVIERSQYEPYGKLINRPNDAQPGYTRYVMDQHTGLTYMQQRYMDPQLGVFLSVDPVTAYSNGDSRYFNRYWYAAGNPYKFTDPDGRGFGLASKLVKLAFKGGDVAATVAGAVEDAKTLVSRDATLGQRALAGGSPLTEVFSPASARDVKAGINAIEGAADASKRLGTDVPLQRYQGPWTERDIARGMEGKGPLDMVPT